MEGVRIQSEEIKYFTFSDLYPRLGRSATVQGPPNPGFMQEKVQKWDFLKKPSRELIFFVVLGS